MRAANRIVATLAALALIAISMIVVVEILFAALGKSPWIVDHAAVANDLHQRTWEDGWVRLVAAGAILVGVLLLYVALKRSAPAHLSLQSDDESMTMTVTRKSLERYIAGVAEAETGVDSSSVRARRGRMGVTASTTLRDPGDLKKRVQHSVVSHLESLRLAEPVTPSVSIRSREN
jgi:hypothetical protein